MGREISKLHPELQIIAEKLKSECEKKGLPVLITETFRTKAEQDELYAQGRTKSGSIVTNVKYPNSAHCWGVALDFCKNVKGQEWNDSDGFFKKVGEIGESLGLEWGGRWTSFVDKPHLQMKKYMPGNSTKMLVDTYRTPENFIRTWGNVEVQSSSGNGNEAIIATGNVTASVLNVRSGPGTSYGKVGELKKGDKIWLNEIVKGWGRIAQGWLSMDYIRLDEPEQKPKPEPELSKEERKEEVKAVIEDPREALDILVENEVINNPEYWEVFIGKINYFYLLLCKMANALN